MGLRESVITADLTSLNGRHVMVTGASGGLGSAVAMALVRAGASVALCARRRQPLDELAARLRREAHPGRSILVSSCDVADPEAVSAWISEILYAYPRVEALVNIAAVLGPIGPLTSCDPVAWRNTFATNLFGTMETSRLLVGHFQDYRYGKIVNLSGGGASASLPRFTAYAASKTAVVRFTETLADELKGEGIDVNAVAPGALATAMTEAVLEAGPETIGSEYHAKINKIISEGGMCIREAAELCAWLCSADSDGISGRLIAAQWDPWRSLACRRDALDCSDIYTLRRILPADRQQDWSD